MRRPTRPSRAQAGQGRGAGARPLERFWASHHSPGHHSPGGRAPCHPLPPPRARRLTPHSAAPPRPRRPAPLPQCKWEHSASWQRAGAGEGRDHRWRPLRARPHVAGRPPVPPSRARRATPSVRPPPMCHPPASLASPASPGENLYFITGTPIVTGKRALWSWYVEARDYDYRDPGRPKRANAMLGHFTQGERAGPRGSAASGSLREAVRRCMRPPGRRALRGAGSRALAGTARPRRIT